MPARYAIYYAPPTDSELWERASKWLGRDAATNINVAQHVPQGLDAEQFKKLTTAPRRYGFHATLKAPMRLAPSATENSLLASAKLFADSNTPVDLGLLAIKNLAGFIALQPVNQTATITQAAADCVVRFEPFRALMSAEDRQKRVEAGLTSRQTELLDQYGYPYVMEEFRFHMTLSERLDETLTTKYMEAAEEWFSPTLGAPISLDRIAVYKEKEPGAAFTRIADFPFGTNKSGDV